jgi:hypothetical protein
MPLSIVQVSPLSVSVTGAFTATVATFGSVPAAGCDVAIPAGFTDAVGFAGAAVCATAAYIRNTATAANMEPKRILNLVMTRTFHIYSWNF